MIFNLIRGCLYPNVGRTTVRNLIRDNVFIVMGYKVLSKLQRILLNEKRK